MAATKKGSSSSSSSNKSSSSSSSSKSKSSPKSKSGSGRRELIDTGTDKRFVRRDGQGQFKESDDVGRSLAADQRRPSRTRTKSGQGDKGDR